LFNFQGAAGLWAGCAPRSRLRLLPGLPRAPQFSIFQPDFSLCLSGFYQINTPFALKQAAYHENRQLIDNIRLLLDCQVIFLIL